MCNQHPGASADTVDLYILKFTVKIIFCLMCLETKKQSVDCVCLNSLGLVCVPCCLSQVFSVKENISIYWGGGHCFLFSIFLIALLIMCLTCFVLFLREGSKGFFGCLLET